MTNLKGWHIRNLIYQLSLKYMVLDKIIKGGISLYRNTSIG